MNRLKPPGRGVRRSVVEALVHVLPTGNHTVVAGWPDEEGNSVGVLRALPSHTDGPVYWLVDSEPNELSWLLDGVEWKERVQLLRKRSMAGVLAYATAHTVFFTHGLYGCPRPPKRKTLVNLWHGDGPKRTDTQHVSPQIRRATLSQEPTCGDSTGRFLRGPRIHLLVTGNPRIDQFARPLTDDQVEALGIPAGRPLVLWLPTYRSAHGPAGQRWDNSSFLSASPDIREQSGPRPLQRSTAWASRSS